jgi:hypothetical protein
MELLLSLWKVVANLSQMWIMNNKRMKALGVVHGDLELREGIYLNILKKNGDIRFIDFHLHELVD